MEEIKKIDRGGDEIRALLQKNLDLNSEIYKMVKGIKRHIFLEQVMSIIKILIFIGLISVGFVYLPPLLNQAFGYYRELIGGLSGVTEAGDTLQVINLESFQSLIKK
jgi:hypothetical protein